MVIETDGRTYRVLLHQERDDLRDIYICENTRDHRHWRVICIKERNLIEKAMEFLYAQMRRTSCSDFEDCFIALDCFYLVFACTQGKLLTEKLLLEKPHISERMEIGKRLMEKLILLDMHPYFLCQCLATDNICVTESLEISFLYNIDDLQAYEEYSLKSVQERIRTLLSFLFGRELYQELIPPMKTFLHELSNSEWPGLIEIYQAYLGVLKEMAEIPEENMIVPRTWEFRLWETLRRLEKPLKWLGGAVLLALVFALMVWNIEQMRLPAKPVPVVSQIGTVMIEEPAQPKEDDMQ